MNDPIVDEVRRIRAEHAERFNYDLWAIYRDLQAQQARSGLKFVSLVVDPAPAADTAPACCAAEQVEVSNSAGRAR